MFKHSRPSPLPAVLKFHLVRFPVSMNGFFSAEYVQDKTQHRAGLSSPSIILSKPCPPKLHPANVWTPDGAFTNADGGRRRVPSRQEWPGSKCNPINRLSPRNLVQHTLVYMFQQLVLEMSSTTSYYTNETHSCCIYSIFLRVYQLYHVNNCIEL